MLRAGVGASLVAGSSGIGAPARYPSVEVPRDSPRQSSGARARVWRRRESKKKKKKKKKKGKKKKRKRNVERRNKK